uniref:Kelch-like protein 21 n=1 Tax=Oreochromis niloticus TaxID=8128 RepID=I3KID6_ORENI
MEKPVLQTQPSTLPFFDTAHAFNLLRGIHELRAERKFFDVTLCAEGREFHCHRTVLAAASTYFRAMFTGTLRESVMDRVVLHEVSGELLGLLVDFCYTGRVTVTQDNVDLLLKTADLFQFPSVKEACCAFLEQRLDVSNCLEIQDFAEAYACRELAASARRFVLKNIMELAKGTDFERLPWKRLLEFVSDDELCVDKEETVYQIAVRWVKADLQRRLHYWPELLQQVRLPFVRRFFLLAHVESDPLVYLSPTCLRMVNEARSFQSCEYDRHDRPCHRMRPRPSTGLAEILVVVGGCDQDCDELVTVDCYNPHTGQWRYLAEFPDHLGGGYSIAALGNDMYVTGGSDGSRLYDGVWRYKSSVNEWTEVSPMLKAREYHSSCILKGQLYVVASDSTERYDQALDCWEALPAMLHPMDNCSTTACSGRLYAIGSLTGEDTMAIQSYDADTNRWTMVNCGQLPPWSFTPKTVTLNGLIYFVRSMLEAVWRPWGLNCTCLVVTTIRLSCPMSWKPTTRSPAPGVLLDDYLSRPSGMAASAFSGSSCPSCRAHSNPLTYPSQTAFSCTGITDTTRSTISITSTRTRIRMWTRHTDLETPIDHVLPHRALSVL